MCDIMVKSRTKYYNYVIKMQLKLVFRYEIYRNNFAYENCNIIKNRIYLYFFI